MSQLTVITLEEFGLGTWRAEVESGHAEGAVSSGPSAQEALALIGRSIQFAVSDLAAPQKCTCFYEDSEEMTRHSVLCAVNE